MPDRTPQGEGPEDRYAADRRRAALNGTGKYPSISRPLNEKRLETSPMPRIAPPPREQPRRRRSRLVLIISLVFVAGVLLACYFGFVAFNFLSGFNSTSGAANTATDFLNALSTQNYEQAYMDMGGGALAKQNLETFKNAALLDDTCYGVVKSYQLVTNSAVYHSDTQSYDYSYTLTRAKLSAPYQLHLTLQQSQTSSTLWKVVDYGSDLGPSPPQCGK